MRHQPFTILLHIAMVVILAGAFVTHFCGIQGKLTLFTDAPPASKFQKESGPGNGELPFTVSLDEVEIDYYPATTTPMDFRSRLTVEGNTLTVTMNKVGEYRGWRFYQSGIGPDHSTLSVSHDPWGTGITYTGYLLLGMGMIGFFFQKNTAWRAMLRKYRRTMPTAVLLLFAAFTAQAAESTTPLPTMQRPLASNLGKVLVYWNDRICPLQTMARDVTNALYDSDSYKGLTSEQVLSGWLFYFDQWKSDYLLTHPGLKQLPPFPTSKEDKKMAEQIALINWIGTGDIFQIYPYTTDNGHIEWLSLTGSRPSDMTIEQWQNMQTTMPKIKRLLLDGKNTQANEEIATLMKRQREYTQGIPLPSIQKIEAERWYNRLVRPAAGGIPAVCAGLMALILPFYRPKYNRACGVATTLTAWLLLLYVIASMGTLWWISGHVPLSNGPETMMFMALASLAGACISRDLTIKGGLLVVTAMSLFVAGMGGSTPAIGSMMPVLSSPLLSIHVMVVMIAYTLLFLMTILAIMALCIKDKERSMHLTVVNRLLLVPAVFLLGAGIFIGAVWANQTWGRYWGWDPKETCALVMWLIYALPLHWASRPLRFAGRTLSLSVFRNDKVFNIYMVMAILSVLFTYFGANYFLSGLHSYA